MSGNAPSLSDSAKRAPGRVAQRTSSMSLLFSLTRLRGCFGGSSGRAFLSPSSFLS